ncbi:MAG TPA: DUF2993 domain-containing protein [Bacillota bacterium]
MRALGRIAAYAGLPLLLAAAAVQWAAPAVMERVAAEAVEGWLGEGHYRVRLHAAPRARLLLGRFDRVEVLGTDLVVAGAVDRLVVVLEDVRVDVWALLLERRLDTTRARRVAFRVELQEHDVAQHLRGEIPFADLTVTLHDDGFRLEGRLPVNEGSMRVQVNGGFDVDDSAPGQVRLTVDRVRVNDREVPAVLVEHVLPVLLEPGLTVDLGGLFPVPVRVTTVDSEEGRLILEGEAVP